jgi:hypothetical protein
MENEKKRTHERGILLFVMKNHKEHSEYSVTDNKKKRIHGKDIILFVRLNYKIHSKYSGMENETKCPARGTSFFSSG